MKILKCQDGLVGIERDDGEKKKMRFWHDCSMTLEELNEVMSFFERLGVSVSDVHIRNAPSFLVMARMKDDIEKDISPAMKCPIKNKACLFCAVSNGELFCGTSKVENKIEKMKECPSDVIRGRKGSKRRMVA